MMKRNYYDIRLARNAAQKVNSSMESATPSLRRIFLHNFALKFAVFAAMFSLLYAIGLGDFTPQAKADKGTISALDASFHNGANSREIVDVLAQSPGAARKQQEAKNLKNNEAEKIAQKTEFKDSNSEITSHHFADEVSSNKQTAHSITSKLPENFQVPRDISDEDYQKAKECYNKRTDSLASFNNGRFERCMSNEGAVFGLGGSGFGSADQGRNARANAYRAYYATQGEKNARIFGGRSPDQAYIDRVVNANTVLDASHYLTYKRWWGSNGLFLPDAAIGNMLTSQLGPSVISIFVSILFSLAATIAFLFGFILSLALSTDLMARTIYMSDYTFYAMSRALLVTNNNSIGSIMLWLVSLSLLSMVISWALPTMQLQNRKAGFFKSLFGLAIFFLLMFQAGKNHNEAETTGYKAPIASIMGSTTLDRSVQLEHGQASNPDLWAPLSPGWTFAELSKIFGGVGDVLLNFIQSLTKIYGTNEVPSIQQGECGHYVGALHQLFTETGAAQQHGNNLSPMVAYDSLIAQVHIVNYKLAAFGANAPESSVDGAWCRSMEVQAEIPVEEQVLVSRYAGLYSKAIGTGPTASRSSGSRIQADLISTAEGLNKPQSDGFLVDAGGHWTNNADATAKSEDGEKEYSFDSKGANSYKLASAFFGPHYMMKNDEDSNKKWNTPNGGVIAVTWFGACRWMPNMETPQLDPAWENVLPGSAGDFNDATKTLGEIDDVCTFGAEGASDEEKGKPIWEVGFGSNSQASDTFNYYDVGDPAGANVKVVGALVAKVSQLYGWASNPQHGIDQFRGAPKAENYFKNTALGSPYSAAIISAFIDLIAIILIMRFFIPLAVGAIATIAVSSIAFMFLSLAVLSLIFPVVGLKRLSSTLISTVFSGMIMSLLLRILFAFTFLIINIFVKLFYIETNSNIFGGTLVGLSTILGIYVAHWVITKMFHIDSSSMSSAITSMKLAAAPMVNKYTGDNVPDPTKKDFYKSRSRKTNDAKKRADAQEPVRPQNKKNRPLPDRTPMPKNDKKQGGPNDPKNQGQMPIPNRGADASDAKGKGDHQAKGGKPNEGAGASNPRNVNNMDNAKDRVRGGTEALNGGAPAGRKLLDDNAPKKKLTDAQQERAGKIGEFVENRNDGNHVMHFKDKDGKSGFLDLNDVDWSNDNEVALARSYAENAKLEKIGENGLPEGWEDKGTDVLQRFRTQNGGSVKDGSINGQNFDPDSNASTQREMLDNLTSGNPEENTLPEMMKIDNLQKDGMSPEELAQAQDDAFRERSYGGHDYMGSNNVITGDINSNAPSNEDLQTGDQVMESISPEVPTTGKVHRETVAPPQPIIDNSSVDIGSNQPSIPQPTFSNISADSPSYRYSPVSVQQSGVSIPQPRIDNSAAPSSKLPSSNEKFNEVFNRQRQDLL